jgi:hypothetical protein
MAATGEQMQLRPGRALAEGMARMFDFMGVLCDETPTSSVEEDMALAWSEVLGAMRPPPPVSSFSPRLESSAAPRVLRAVGR